MNRQPSFRRRSSSAPQLCVAGASILILLSLSILHIRLSSSPSSPFNPSPNSNSNSNSNSSPLFDDSSNDAFDTSSDDRIDELDVLEDDHKPLTHNTHSNPALFWDHSLGVARISFGRTESREEEEDYSSALEELGRSKVTYASDDELVDEAVKAKVELIRGTEDGLLLKFGGDGWVKWLEGKGEFLRRDRMLRSKLEMLNPKNFLLLQDPDVAGFRVFTRGDRMMQKAMLKEMEEGDWIGREVKGVEGRRALGIEAELGFSEFIDRFFGSGQCSIRVFMVWNSPSWSFGIRQQRGLESLLHHHRNACVVLFSETIELDFFEDFVKDGFRIAVVMPNLDELLMDTPAHIFASVWLEWRKTKYYPIHYSELVRLAALYKYGGVYLDSDLIVLKPLYSIKNSVCVEDQRDGTSTYNGAVMAFERHSPFVKECLTEFYSTYDDTLLMRNGADLLTRVIKRLQGKSGKSWEELRVNIISPQSIFPISSMEITRYFAVASEESERVYHEILFRKILNESYTFHFWNGLTSALVPEPGSLAEKLLNHYCLRCLDIL